MHKVLRRRRLFLTLPGIMLVVAFLLNIGASLAATIPTAQAEATEPAHPVDTSRGPSPPPVCDATQHWPNFGSTLEVRQGQTICGDLTAFGGRVIIHGEVRGDVVVFGGNVILDGNIIGNIYLYGGDLITPDRAHVDGDIHFCGGHSTTSPGLELHGSFFSCTGGFSTLLVEDAGLQMRFWYILTWVMLGIVLTTLLPEHVMIVRTTVSYKFRRSLALGLLSILLAPVIMAVLIALIVAIPLAILIAIGVIAAWALGTVAAAWIVGDKIVPRIMPQHNTRLIQIVVGLVIVAFLGSLPYIGWIISGLTGMVGLGAVFLSRFGTRLYSQPKRPIIW